VTARFCERVTARAGWRKRDTEKSPCFLSFYPADLDSFGPTASQASGRPLMLGSLYAPWPPTQSSERKEHCVAGIDPTKVARFLSGRPESLKSEGYPRNNCTAAIFLRDRLHCSREEGGARFYLILYPLCNEVASRFCWIFFAPFFDLDDRCNLYYSAQNLIRNSLVPRLYE